MVLLKVLWRGVLALCVAHSVALGSVESVSDYLQIAQNKAWKAHLRTIIDVPGDTVAAFVPDWLKCERFRDSIWSYVPKALAESAVKTEHKKDDIVELAVAWAPKDYSGANWNALLLRNFVNRALDDGVKSVEGEVYRAAVNLGRHDKYGRYKDKLAAAVIDIKIYARAMRLYDFLREMKQIRYAAMLTDGQIATGTHVAPKCTGRFLNTDTMFSSSGNIVFEEFKPLGIEHRGGYVVLDINSQEVSPYYRMREPKSGYNLHFFLDDEMRVSTTMGFLAAESKLCDGTGQGYYTLAGCETEFTTNDTARSLGYGGFSAPDVFFGDATQPCKFCANVRFSDLRPLAITPQVNDGLGGHAFFLSRHQMSSSRWLSTSRFHVRRCRLVPANLLFVRRQCLQIGWRI